MLDLLEGVRVLECSLLEPAALGMTLAEFGADVVKVEPPGGDYVRQMAWPVIDGVSILHWHVNRGKRSVVVDLRTDEGVQLFLELVENCDVLIEAMRPGALARRGLTTEALHERNPTLVVCSVSGWGMTGPYRDLPAHGIGFDVWAGIAPPVTDENGFPTIPDHTTVGIRVAPLWGALAVAAALLRVRTTGEGVHLDLAQADAAAATNWLRIEGARAYERTDLDVTGNPSDGGERREPGVAGMADSVRYQFYSTADGHVLLMASEQELWRNFCYAAGRPELYDAHPGHTYADHARGDLVLRRELQALFSARTTQEWIQLGVDHNCPIAPVNTAASISADPQFQDRLPWLSSDEFGTDLIPNPVRLVDRDGQAIETRPVRRAPSAGEHSDEVLSTVLGKSRAEIDALVASGAVQRGP